MNAGVGWYTALARDIGDRSAVFFHAGALLRTVSFEEDLVAALVGRGLEVCQVDARDAVERGWDYCFPDLGAINGRSLLLLKNLEEMASRRDFELVLRQSRPRGQQAIASGARVLVVSKRPKLFFPQPDGSSVVADCASIRPPKIDTAELLVMRSALSDEAATRIVRFAAGSIALLEFYSELELARLAGNEKRRRSQAFLASVLQEALRELNPETLSLLEYLALECGTYDLLEEDLDGSDAAALENSGLTQVSDAEGAVSLFAESWRDVARESLSSVLRSIVEPPIGWQSMAKKLFMFERTVRMVLSEALELRHGAAWKAKLGEQGERALSMARGDAVAMTAAIDDLHSPLDWLLLDDLLDLASMEAMSDGGICGVQPRVWQRFKAQLVPIRNRVAHMRLPRDEDAAVVSRALRYLQTRAAQGRR